MGTPLPPPPRQQLAEALKRARIGAGYSSQAALARALNVSRSLITKAESPVHGVPSVDVITAWAAITGASEDELVDLAKRCRSGTPDWFGDYLIAEASADTVRSWSPVLVYLG
jgi:transcriptional regulator with XRE-family HTH domain